MTFRAAIVNPNLFKKIKTAFRGAMCHNHNTINQLQYEQGYNEGNLKYVRYERAIMFITNIRYNDAIFTPDNDFVITRFDYEAHLNEGLQVNIHPLRFF